MAFLDVFKKNKERERKPAAKKPPQKKEKVKIESPKAKKTLSAKQARVIKFPHVTEKSSRLAEENKYVFRVEGWANKNEIKEAVERIYGVDVTGVAVISVPRKARRLGRNQGWKKGFKKAVVKVKKGQKIEIMPH
jgi:large subunit ribosomal protein L23